MAVYHCIDPACGRIFPRQVAFCPYCGLRQGAVPAGEIPGPPQVEVAPAEQRAAMPADAAPLAPPPAAAPPQAPPPAAPAPQAPPQLPRKPLRIPELDPELTRAAAPPLPAPISKRSWLMVLLALAAIWAINKPRNADRQIEARIDQAVALTANCRIDAARAELAQVKAAKAGPGQWQRLQQAIAQAAPACEHKRLRARAWREAAAAIDTALQQRAVDKAAGRLALFARRWGEDADTAAMGERIEAKRTELLLDQAEACLRAGDDACVRQRLARAGYTQRPELAARIAALRAALARRRPAPPSAVLLSQSPAVVAALPPRLAQQVDKMLADASREVEQGNYRGAMDRMEICVTLLDSGNRACQAVRDRAERLNRAMLRCVASGADWGGQHCQ